MIPAQTAAGRSFKGAAAYYLHDKAAEGRGHPFSAERVAWTETVNLATDDPERGWRMMTHTAMAQSDLKAAAGVKATGRKLEKPVFAYSLSWSVGEHPDRAEQMKAAKETLHALGLQDHQAIIVSHNDEPHPHIHVLVNRVHPENGIAANLGNSKLKLSKWALGYSKANGTDHLTPERERNHERRRKGQEVKASRKPRPIYEQEQASKATGNDDLKAEFIKTEQRQKDAHLYDMGRAMRASHARQWEETKRVYATAQARINAFAQQTGDAAAARVKEQAKPRWRELFRQQRQERQQFEAAERGIIGRMLHMVGTYRALRAQDPNADALTIFYALMSSARRIAILDRAHEGQRRGLAVQIKEEARDARRGASVQSQRDHAKLRTTYLQQCASLKTGQGKQRAELEALFAVRRAERIAALAPYRARPQRQSRGRSIRNDDRYRKPPARGPGPS